MTAMPDNAAPDPQQIIAELQRKLDESRAELAARNSAYSERIAYQAAANDVLKVMSASPSDPQPVFDLISVRARDICGAYGVTVCEFDGSLLHWRAATGISEDPAVREAAKAVFPTPPTRDMAVGRAILNRAIVHIRDFETEPGLRRFSLTVKSSVVVPLMRGSVPIGTLQMGSRERGGFSDIQVELLKTFAEQAVIAIGSAETYRALQTRTTDLQESLQQQTATADVLEVISRSAFDLNPVFETVAERSVRLCGSERAVILRFDGELLRVVAAFNAPHDLRDWLERNPIRPGRHSVAARAALECRTVQVSDVLADPEHTYGAKNVWPFRTVLGVPMLKGAVLLGVILVYHNEVRPFTDKQIALVETFADQAVIAIENVRLFDEVQHRTDDLAESLQQQTATSEVLKVISSSTGDLQPVFDQMLEKATGVCGAEFGLMGLFDGDMYRRVASYNVPQAFEASAPRERRPDPDAPIGIVGQTGQVVRIDDLSHSELYLARRPAVVLLVEAAGARTLVVVPMLRDARPIGAISIYRKEVRPFNDRQVELLKNFASQAVIAIENTRLFNETREALERQTATADILKVIASSPTDVQPVFEAIAERSNRLIAGFSASVFSLDGDMMHLSAFTRTNPAADEALKKRFPSPLSARSWGEQIRNGEIVLIPDTEVEGAASSDLRNSARMRGYRSMLHVPLLRERTVIGLISVTRVEPGPFSTNHVQLLQTFADQAVIAIENVRLFDEVQARTRDLSESLHQQTATAEVLKAISRSTFDLQTVLHTLVESAAKLSEADRATITRQRDGVFYRAESYGHSDERLKVLRTFPMEPERGSASGRALLEGTVVHIPDIEADREFTFNQKFGDFRTVLAVPMLREGTPIGVIVLTRVKPRPFTDKQIELVTTFADQAVIAISNVNLFEQVQERTRELSKSLDDLRAAQDRLVQTEKLASLGQLTAGIAHEIKNPLNFVNNFSALSAELIEEMKDMLSDASLDKNKREDLDEITQMLKSNLDKVVQHGKRADSIVKNMLLHSRQGSGEHRPVDINAIVDESLNLAYHGARAENTGFNITMHRSFDPAVGMADGYPQEITRALLNLISNGFYAATKRKSDAGDGFEPTLTATTKNLGDKVEIRIRDNGTGIPTEVKEKIFNPFFTTKPAGEGTGLGLSMSHDIVVKQHGGTIDVVSEPGASTEFRIVLPRTGAALTKSGEQG